jgi:hypothetical protein
MVLLGVLARIDAPEHDRVCGALDQLPGVSSFSVGETQRVGILVERETIEEAHAALSSEVGRVPGVMAAWPVFSHIESTSGGEQ